MNNIICGTTIAFNRNQLLKKDIDSFTQEYKRPPHLNVILVGNHLPSETYVRAKQKACNLVGIKSTIIRIAEENFESNLKNAIAELNENPKVDGILLQLPLPNRVDPFPFISQINYKKDVDGLSPYNLGRLISKKPTHIPCTPQGVMNLLQFINEDLENKNIVVLGRSILVGKPLAILLEQANANVTLIHSKTINQKSICKNADILICAIGQPEYITIDFVKPGAVVIDVGITKVGSQLKGDVNFDNVQKIAKWITPIPGGVGPMTVSFLLENTLKSALINSDNY